MLQQTYNIVTMCCKHKFLPMIMIDINVIIVYGSAIRSLPPIVINANEFCRLIMRQ